MGVSSQSLNFGTYTGSVQFDASNASSLNVPVTLVVNPQAAGTQLSATPSPLALGVETASPATNAIIQLTNLTTVAANLPMASSVPWITLSPQTVNIPPYGVTTVTATIKPAAHSIEARAESLARSCESASAASSSTASI